MTFEQLKGIALKEFPNANYYVEYPDAYLFTVKEARDFGGTSPLVIEKETGECMPFVVAITDGLITDELNEGYLV